MARALRRFTVSPQDEGFSLEIEDDEGEILEMTASRDQIEVIADTLDDLLQESEDEEGDAA